MSLAQHQFVITDKWIGSSSFSKSSLLLAFTLFLHSSLWTHVKALIELSGSEKCYSFFYDVSCGFFSPKSIRMVFLFRETLWVSVFIKFIVYIYRLRQKKSKLFDVWIFNLTYLMN